MPRIYMGPPEGFDAKGWTGPYIIYKAYQPQHALKIVKALWYQNLPRAHTRSSSLVIGSLSAAPLDSILEFAETANNFVFQNGILGLEGIYLSTLDMLGGFIKSSDFDWLATTSDQMNQLGLMKSRAATAFAAGLNILGRFNSMNNYDEFSMPLGSVRDFDTSYEPTDSRLGGMEISLLGWKEQLVTGYLGYMRFPLLQLGSQLLSLEAGLSSLSGSPQNSLANKIEQLSMSPPQGIDANEKKRQQCIQDGKDNVMYGRILTGAVLAIAGLVAVNHTQKVGLIIIAAGTMGYYYEQDKAVVTDCEKRFPPSSSGGNSESGQENSSGGASGSWGEPSSGGLSESGQKSSPGKQTPESTSPEDKPLSELTPSDQKELGWTEWGVDDPNAPKEQEEKNDSDSEDKPVTIVACWPPGEEPTEGKQSPLPTDASFMDAFEEYFPEGSGLQMKVHAEKMEGFGYQLQSILPETAIQPNLDLSSDIGKLSLQQFKIVSSTEFEALRQKLG
jgi:hypothetical protein